MTYIFKKQFKRNPFVSEGEIFQKKLKPKSVTWVMMIDSIIILHNDRIKGGCKPTKDVYKLETVSQFIQPKPRLIIS